MADNDITRGGSPDKTAGDNTDDICRTALLRYSRWREREVENIDLAYEDLQFRAGEQWPGDVVKERAVDKRPMLTINRIPQFVRQVTGDMRQMKPSIKVVPVDSRGDKDTADTIAGMIRYVENRSDASAAYMSGADSQVNCGIGAWRVCTEYSDHGTFNQELRITSVDDAVAIAFDPDATLPTREDGKWCIVPVDMSNDAFKEQYPDAELGDFDTVRSVTQAMGWYDKDFVRVAEYWVKEPIKRTLALMPDGSIVDITDDEDGEAKQFAKRIEKRDSHKVVRYLITAAHVLEGPTDWPGMYIPIVPVLGEEVRIGRRTVRHGIVRYAKDPQRMYNYFRTTQTEVAALQPKAPWLGTEQNFEKYQADWATANTKNHPALIYTPDARNGGREPSRVAPPIASQGIEEGVMLAAEDMKGVIGIYDAGLGNKSNETSGKAILARQREGDVGSFVYIDNWSRAIRFTGTLLIDLIPHVYDTERMIRIMGDDGHVDLKWINRSVGMQEMHPETGEMMQTQKIENDVTIGAYDVVLETGPSFSTKRAEAKDSLVEFIRSAPETAPAILDLVAKAQDWPNADEVAKRMEAIAPPPIQKLLAEQKKERGQEDPPQQPDPMQQMQMAAAQADLQNKQLENQKLQIENQQLAQGQGPDHAGMAKAAGLQQGNQIAAERARIEHASMLNEMQAKERIAAVQLEIALTELAIKKAGAQIDTAAAVQDLQHTQMGMQQEAEQHTAGLVQGFQKHDTAMMQGAEAHAAKVKQMNTPKAAARPA